VAARQSAVVAPVAGIPGRRAEGPPRPIFSAAWRSAPWSWTNVGGDTVLTALSAETVGLSPRRVLRVPLRFILGIVYGGKIVRHRHGPDDPWPLPAHPRAVPGFRRDGDSPFLALNLVTGIRLWTDRAYPAVIADPWEAAVGILTLHHDRSNGSDVLVMYTLMLLPAPLIFYLLSRGYTRTVLLGSIGVWALTSGFRRRPRSRGPSPEAPSRSAPWQLLLVLGIVAGYHRTALFRWLCSDSLSCKLLIAAAALGVYLLQMVDSQYGAVSLQPAVFGDATVSSLFAKTSLGPGRVLAFILLEYSPTLRSTRSGCPSRLLGWLILPLGQSSLYVYVAHLFVICRDLQRRARSSHGHFQT